MSIDNSVNQLKEKISGMITEGIKVESSLESCIELLSNKKVEFTSRKYIKAENKLISYFKALSNPHRLKIIILLKSGVKCSCELEYSLGLSQPSISHHLKILEKSNIVSIRAKGKWKLIDLNETPIIYWILDQLMLKTNLE